MSKQVSLRIVHSNMNPIFHVVIQGTFSKLPEEDMKDRGDYTSALFLPLKLLEKHLLELNEQSYFSSMGINARMIRESRLKVQLNPENPRTLRIHFAFWSATGTYSGSEVIRALVQKKLPNIIGALPKSMPFTLKSTTVEWIRQKKPLVAGFASREEINEQMRWLPGERVMWPNDESEKAHPNTRVERMEGNLAHCFDNNGETFTVNYHPV